MFSNSRRRNTKGYSSALVGLSSVAFRAETLSASATRSAMNWFSSEYASTARPSRPIASVYTSAAFGALSTALNNDVRKAVSWSAAPPMSFTLRR